MALATADSIIMNKVVESVSKCEGTSHVVNSLVPMLPGIIVMVIIKKALDNAGEIFRGIGKYLFMKMLDISVIYQSSILIS